MPKTPGVVAMSSSQCVNNDNDNDNDNEISFILTQVNTSLLATLLGLLCGIANTIT